MSVPRDLAAAQREDVLRQAIERRLPIVGSVWQDNRWTMLRSRFLPRDPGGELLCIELATADGPHSSPGEPAELTAGTNLNVTFRRGHHKCMFATTVVGRQRVVLSPKLKADALLIRRPQRVQQLQRRAYERAIAPDSPAIAVTLRAGSWNEAAAARPTFTAVLVDLSAGGTRVRITSDSAPTPTIGQSFAIELQPPGEPPLRMDGLYRHCQAQPSGALSWGLQLIGLEASEERCATLASIARLVRGWERQSGQSGANPSGADDDHSA